ncbi:MAG: YggT family protein [Actinobacteria bacterium]|nr:YggT family protein [Actinomycetota bacterium]
MRNLVCAFLTVYYVVLFARIIISWFPVEPGSPIAAIHRILYDVTEPVLAPVRGLVPPVRTGPMAFDLSPIIVFIALIILQRAICT